MTIEGFINDQASLEPVAGVQIFVHAIKSPPGMGFLGGKRESVGSGTTNSRGYYKIKMKVFKEAERIELFINGANLRAGYVYIQPIVYLPTLNRHGSNTLNYLLSPTALLKIKFKNLNPVSDTDFFSFSWYYTGQGLPKGVLQKESCGTIVQSEAGTFTGKDVCGEYTVDAVAESASYIYWTVRKNNVATQHIDPIFVRRGIVNTFVLNY